MPAMLGCSTVCPKCQHHFACCPPTPCCQPATQPATTPSSCCAPTPRCNARRSWHVLSGGGIITANLCPASAVVCGGEHLSACGGMVQALSPLSPCPSPQVSPSAPLTFVMPPFVPLQLALPPAAEARPETELQRLSEIMRALRLSGWYYEGITYQQSHDLLKNTKLGTFLVRDSSDPRYLFSLSVQTKRGPTSVRLYYVNGHFRLDAQPHLQAVMPTFPSVVELVQHYVGQSRGCENGGHVWVDPRGELYSPILLERPLKKDATPQSLKHLARLAINKAMWRPTRHDQLELPASLTAYLAEYPYSL